MNNENYCNSMNYVVELKFQTPAQHKGELKFSINQAKYMMAFSGFKLCEL